ncbi:MAG: hypothetical protein FJ265_12345 [Planctomycetes bacterium]|nr:hypothetical protein [Planctomycetota bacterium]
MASSAAPAVLAAPPRGPFRLAVGVLVATTVAILKGAMTTSTGSGLAYPDWPLSDGQVMPESSYTTLAGFFEHFHRLAAATSGLLALWLALWLQVGRRHVPGLGSARARTTAWLGGTLILVQGVIGGVGVLENLPAVTSVTHGTLAQLTLATFGCLAYQLSARYARTAPVTTVPPGTGRKLAVAAVLALVVQTAIGAVARHTNHGHALWTHVGNSFLVFVLLTIATAFASGRLGAAPGIAGLGRALMLALVAQIGLGFTALLLRNPAGKTQQNVEQLGAAFAISLHVLVGALVTVLAATLAAHVFRATRRPDAAGVAA